jgi:hypothetical protein
MKPATSYGAVRDAYFRPACASEIIQILNHQQIDLELHLLIGYLMNSRDVTFSRTILNTLLTIPENQLSANKDVEWYFGQLGEGRIHANVNTCLKALDLCFEA